MYRTLGQLQTGGGLAGLAAQGLGAANSVTLFYPNGTPVPNGATVTLQQAHDGYMIFTGPPGATIGAQNWQDGVNTSFDPNAIALVGGWKLDGNGTLRIGGMVWEGGPDHYHQQATVRTKYYATLDGGGHYDLLGDVTITIAHSADLAWERNNAPMYWNPVPGSSAFESYPLLVNYWTASQLGISQAQFDQIKQYNATAASNQATTDAAFKAQVAAQQAQWNSTAPGGGAVNINDPSVPLATRQAAAAYLQSYVNPISTQQGSSGAVQVTTTNQSQGGASVTPSGAATPVTPPAPSVLPSFQLPAVLTQDVGGFPVWELAAAGVVLLMLMGTRR